MSRVAILVLGMHRSGTSALTRVASLLGAVLPKHLMSANWANVAGFWEPLRLTRLNDQMLAEAGSRWDDWRRFDPTVLGPKRLERYKHEIRSLIAEEYGDARLLVLKDPRICRFVPLYETILGELGIEPRCLLIDRNPLAVIESLDRRDGLTEGFASLLWLRHTLDAERDTRGKPRAFLSYEAFLDDWRPTLGQATEALGLDWPRKVEEAAGEIESHLSRDLQHHPRTFAELEAHSGLAAWIKEAYAALRGLGRENGESVQDLACLDRIRKSFEEAAAIFGAATFPELEARQRQSVAEMGRVAKDTAPSAASTTELRAENDALEEKLTAERAAVSHLVTEADTLRHETAALRHQLDYMIGSSSWRLTAPLRATLRGLRAVRHRSRGEAAREPAAPRPKLPGLAPDSEEAAALQLTEEQAAHARATLESADVGRFSIVMATWNRRDIVGRAIESVLAQSYPSWELILCDDGSTDGTQAYVERRFGAHLASGRIRYLRLEHRGVSAARNAGLRAAYGPWVAYLDSDCVWHPHYLLMTAAGYASNGHRQTAYACVHVHDEVAQLEFIRYRPFEWQRLVERNFIDLNVFSHDRSLFDELGGFDESLTRLVDWDFILRYSRDHEPQCNPFVLCDYYIAHRLHNISLRESLSANEAAIRRKLAKGTPPRRTSAKHSTSSA